MAGSDNSNTFKFAPDFVEGLMKAPETAPPLPLKDSRLEHSFAFIEDGQFRKNLVFKTEYILRVGSDPAQCDLPAGDARCSPVQIVFLRLESGWLLMDIGEPGIVRFNGFPLQQAIIPPTGKCVIKLDCVTLLFTSGEKKSSIRRYKALPLKKQVTPIDLEDADLTAASCRIFSAKSRMAGVNKPIAESVGEMLVFGTNPICDVVLQGSSAAPVHAYLYWGPDGVYIEDLEGQGRTMVNRTTVTDGEPVRLDSDNLVRLGNAALNIDLSTGVRKRGEQLHALRAPAPGFRFSPLPDAPGEAFVVDADVPAWVAGRGDDAHFLVPDTSASRMHCQMEPSGNRIIVRDLESANGTLINGHAIDAAYAAPGDVILIGSSAYLLHYKLR